jgi:hypothetical protein
MRLASTPIPRIALPILPARAGKSRRTAGGELVSDSGRRSGCRWLPPNGWSPARLPWRRAAALLYSPSRGCDPPLALPAVSYAMKCTRALRLASVNKVINFVLDAAQTITKALSLVEDSS